MIQPPQALLLRRTSLALDIRTAGATAVKLLDLLAIGPQPCFGGAAFVHNLLDRLELGSSAPACPLSHPPQCGLHQKQQDADGDDDHQEVE